MPNEIQENGAEETGGTAADGSNAGVEGAQGAHVPTVLYCNLGDVTNLAVARGSTCLFTRISPFGVESIAARLAERRSLVINHARQWLVHVGLDRPTAEIEGDAEIIAATRETLDEGVGKLADEVRLSLDFYAAQEEVPPVESVVVAGPGSMIPGLVERLQAGLGQPVSSPLPAALSQLGESAAARLIVSYGLALEE
jgi:type IV pilus assembly protein PilM